jgi:hypothetical protein
MLSGANGALLCAPLRSFALLCAPLRSFALLCADGDDARRDDISLIELTTLGVSSGAADYLFMKCALLVTRAAFSAVVTPTREDLA